MVKIAACQLPEIREDMDATLSLINDHAKRAMDNGVQLLCFPECFLQGYLLEESIAWKNALDLTSNQFTSILKTLPANSPVLVIGLIETKNAHLYNSAVVIKDQQLLGVYRKTHLLSGERIFSAGTLYPIFQIGQLIFGINICYDTNFPMAARNLADQGAQLIVCPANNMMGREKSEQYRHVHNAVRAERCRETGLWLISSDVTGEQSGRVSYGPTAIIDPSGRIIAQLPLLEAGMLIAEIELKPKTGYHEN